MSVSSVRQKGKGIGYRFDFCLNRQRYTSKIYPTKAEAKREEAARREAIRNPKPISRTPTDMAFSDLVNDHLDYIKAYRTEKHYRDYTYIVRKWVAVWGSRMCSQITQTEIQQFILKRTMVSNHTANKNLRYLRATFNFGIKQGIVIANPTNGIEKLPVEEHPVYVPPKEDVTAVLLAADPDTQDYLVCIRETLARMSEVNNLLWEDVDFARNTVTLYTRKKRGGHRKGRRIEMTGRLRALLERRHKGKASDKPWVFWHRYWSSKAGEWTEGPYIERKRIMRTLCERAGVRYFRFHALRHCGASVLDQSRRVSIGTIQRILGHENRRTTERYLHTLSREESEAMEIFEQEWTDCDEVTHKVTHKKNQGP
jgi:integrase